LLEKHGLDPDQFQRERPAARTLPQAAAFVREWRRARTIIDGDTRPCKVQVYDPDAFHSSTAYRLQVYASLRGDKDRFLFGPDPADVHGLWYAEVS
jgi:hypothetical protein